VNGSTASDPAGEFSVGYWLSSEEHPPPELVRNARDAEAAGFRAAMISDHFHPWTPDQGSSSFVWTVIGAIAQATRLHLATGVTAPICRMHPAVVAHAAATATILLEGRFALGLGTGERLNEHVTGARWERPATRRRMLAEAIEIIRPLLRGELVNHDGEHFTVEHAQLYTHPATPPPLWIAASGPSGARLAGRAGDGLVAVEPNPKLTDAYAASGGTGIRVGQLHVCVADTVGEACETARRWWRHGALPPALFTELARPQEFAAASAAVTEKQIADAIVCGPDPDRHVVALARFASAGFHRVYVHQVGPEQRAMLALYARDVLPSLSK
jgi:G6PDH family F420-dependent oxidoreductase